MKKLMIISTIAFATILFTACKEHTIWVYYDETGCSDNWGDSEISDIKKIKNVKKYLKSKQIHVFKVNITRDGTREVCFACSCKTGKRIKCKINESDLYKAINENFYQ